MSNSKKKGFFLTRWFKRLFLGHDQEVRDIMQEEQVQTPFRIVSTTVPLQTISMPP